MAMGQKDLFPLWQGSVEMAQTLMMMLGEIGGEKRPASIHSSPSLDPRLSVRVSSSQYGWLPNVTFTQLLGAYRHI